MVRRTCASLVQGGRALARHRADSFLQKSFSIRALPDPKAEHVPRSPCGKAAPRTKPRSSFCPSHNQPYRERRLAATACPHLGRSGKLEYGDEIPRGGGEDPPCSACRIKDRGYCPSRGVTAASQMRRMATHRQPRSEPSESREGHSQPSDRRAIREIGARSCCPA